MTSLMDLTSLRLGIHGPLAEWLEFNRTGAFTSPELLGLIAPFPPLPRMIITTGLTEPKDFASHGYDILKALSEASPTPLSDFHDVLDFGVGVGRLARMFKGFRGRYTGVDVDARNVAWVDRALSHVKAVLTKPRKTLPLTSQQFDLIISVSVFSHMSERDQLFYLAELARLATPGAIVLLTVHGERALQRAETEDRIYKMLEVSASAIKDARQSFQRGGFRFIRQWFGHLNNLFYAYGITFISEDYARRVWSKYFDVISIRSGAIHDFQDIIVLRAR